MAVTVKGFEDSYNESGGKLGAMLYKKRVSGHKVVCKSKVKEVCGVSFSNYGSSCEDYPYLPYITMACSIGGSFEELEEFLRKLKGLLFAKKKNVEMVKEIVEDQEKKVQEVLGFDEA